MMSQWGHSSNRLVVYEQCGNNTLLTDLLEMENLPRLMLSRPGNLELPHTIVPVWASLNS